MANQPDTLQKHFLSWLDNPIDTERLVRIKVAIQSIDLDYQRRISLSTAVPALASDIGAPMVVTSQTNKVTSESTRQRPKIGT